MSIVLKDGGLSDADGDIIAHGFLDLANMGQLLVDDYQREVLHRTKKQGRRTGIEHALAEKTRLPSIVVGMRGSNVITRGDNLILNDPCYIIDGLQRISGIKRYAEEHPDKAAAMVIGAEVRFSTTKDSEKTLFQALNSYRTAMSPNVILRNMRDKNKAVLTIYGLSMSDSSSPLFRRVQWNQRMARGELVTAAQICTIARLLHGRGQTISGSGGVGAADLLNATAEQVGLANFRRNVRTFFDFMDECYHISKIEHTKMATPLKGNFMGAVARFLSDHDAFWDDKVLAIPPAERRKFAAFPAGDFEISRLSGAGAAAMPILYEILKEHMNKRRHNKLTPREKQVWAMTPRKAKS